MKSLLRGRPELIEDHPESADFATPLQSVPTLSPAPPDEEVVSDADARRARGLRALGEITGASAEAVLANLGDLAPDLTDWLVDFSHGDVASRPGLDRHSRQLAIVAALTALGNAAPQLESQIRAARNVGCTKQEIIEVILQMAVFAGFPAMINGLTAARATLHD